MQATDIDATLAKVRAAAPDEALAILRDLFRRHPEHPEATRLLAGVLDQKGDSNSQAKAMALSRAYHDAELLHAARLLGDNKLSEAEAVLRPYWKDRPEEPAAHFLMADLALRAGHADDAETLLGQALALAPTYRSARFKLAHMLFEDNRLEEALEHFDLLLADVPGDTRIIDLKARTLNRLGRVEDAAALYERMVGMDPGNAKLWAHYGHSLRFLGRQDESVDAYRKALELDASLAPVWWSLANLKTVQLAEKDVDRMLSDLGRDGVGSNDRAHLHFALAKALEDQGSIREAFGHYLEGNALRRAEHKHDPALIAGVVREAAQLCDQPFFAERTSFGIDDAGPVFIVGMPRAGSTLVEQILASHPDVEGLAELPYAAILSRQLGTRSGRGYPSSLADLGEQESKELGHRFLELVKPHRLLGRPMFVDKNPNNWLVLDFIQLILPNSRIIDVRRHPLDCGISNFRQLFAEGQEYSYSLEHIGRYYRDYVAMMQRVDDVLPGRVHRVIYERLVNEPRAEVASVLEFLRLSFDERCLSFYENTRSVRTPSSEQVRRPINRDSVDHWRKFDPWINPLKEALGSVLHDYPDAPDDLKI